LHTTSRASIMFIILILYLGGRRSFGCFSGTRSFNESRLMWFIKRDVNFVVILLWWSKPVFPKGCAAMTRTSDSISAVDVPTGLHVVAIEHFYRLIFSTQTAYTHHDCLVIVFKFQPKRPNLTFDVDVWFDGC